MHKTGKPIIKEVSVIVFKKYFDDSSWGPYLRPFLGLSHNIYSGPSGSQNLNLGFGGIAAGTFYYLHPGADLRLELGQGFGPQSWTYLSFGVVFKFRNICGICAAR